MQVNVALPAEHLPKVSPAFKGPLKPLKSMPSKNYIYIFDASLVAAYQKREIPGLVEWVEKRYRSGRTAVFVLKATLEDLKMKPRHLPRGFKYLKICYPNYRWVMASLVHRISMELGLAPQLVESMRHELEAMALAEYTVELSFANKHTFAIPDKELDSSTNVFAFNSHKLLENALRTKEMRNSIDTVMNQQSFYELPVCRWISSDGTWGDLD